MAGRNSPGTARRIDDNDDGDAEVAARAKQRDASAGQRGVSPAEPGLEQKWRPTRLLAAITTKKPTDAGWPRPSSFELRRDASRTLRLASSTR